MALHILRHVYDKVPTLKAVCQDYAGPLEVGKKYWAEQLPEALKDGRVEFEVHDFFNENPRKEPNTMYWMRFIMREQPILQHLYHITDVSDLCRRLARQVREPTITL